jgi:CheY-like chemotaxis protein
MIQPISQAAVVFGGILFGTAAINSDSTVTVGCAFAVLGATIGSAWWSGRKWQSFLDHQKTLADGVKEQAERLERVELKVNDYDGRFSELDRKVEALGLARKLDLDRLRLDLINGRESGEGAKPLILLVDDDPTDRALFKRSMGLMYRIDEATSLGEATTMADAKRYDCVVIDLYLPDSVPDETVFRFVKDHPMAVCVAFSGTKSEEHINTAIKSGADSFIAKGHILESAYVSKMIRLAMDRKRIE